MGMYTTLFLAVEFKETTPSWFIEMLRTACSEQEPKLFGVHVTTPKNNQNEKLTLEKLRQIFQHFSYYQQGPTVAKLELDIQNFYRLLVYSSFKNYHDEIKGIVKWLSPWVQDVQTILGWSWYEEDEQPTLLIKES